MSDCDLTGKIIDYEMGDLDDAATIELFQRLVESGLAWRLQGTYGRTAKALIDAGYVSVGAGVGTAQTPNTRAKQ